MLALTLFRLAAFGMDWTRHKHHRQARVRPEPAIRQGRAASAGRTTAARTSTTTDVLLRSAAHGWLWPMPPYRLVVRADPDFPRRQLSRKLLSAAAADEEAAGGTTWARCGGLLHDRGQQGGDDQAPSQQCYARVQPCALRYTTPDSPLRAAFPAYTALLRQGRRARPVVTQQAGSSRLRIFLHVL